MVERAKKPSAIPVSPLAPSPQVSFSDDNTRVTATLPTGESIEVLLHGATVISWKSGGGENLFLSDKAKLDGSKPVRGGIPLVFPIFGPPPSSGPVSSLPQHGFARTSRWEYLNKSTSESSTAPNSASDNSVKLDFGLSSSNLSAEAKKAWPYDFGLIYSVTLGKDGLETSLCVRNEGADSFEFQFLLHSYLRVKDITQTTVQGLEGTAYTDKVGGASEKETGAALSFAGETDRVYKSLDPEAIVTVLEGSTKRFELTRDNLDDVVVWNPWTEKAGGMADFGPADGWKNMLCIEAGAVSSWQRLEAGDTFEGGQIIRALL
ncbi:MAG: hypothetical protein M1832_004190 [Thelocarpon impressellum]|nr:MAG: hypothetical protein M1832_004190 [Thelocarpon impressellum]